MAHLFDGPKPAALLLCSNPRRAVGREVAAHRYPMYFGMMPEVEYYRRACEQVEVLEVRGRELRRGVIVRAFG